MGFIRCLIRLKGRITFGERFYFCWRLVRKYMVLGLLVVIFVILREGSV